ncbi:MAG: LysR family transcriptional regulator [Verrucomicrobiaceae bacterium]|nr:LysR family transcriptional regulator [Verrucomicrobiaceae bacterium]
MEFHQLRYFIAAAEEHSITRASARLHLTQPALSRQIAALEDELGIKLFDRVKQRITLTEAGRFFLGKARQMLCDAETMTQQVRELYGAAPKTVRLGFLPVLLDDLIAPALKEFRQRHPKARVSLFELAPAAQLDRLRAGELDAAVLGNMDDRDRAQFSVRKLSQSTMAAVLPENHPLAKRKSLSLSQLAEENWVSLSDTIYPGRRNFLRQICSKAGFEPEIVSEVDSLSLMLWSVASGEGVALMPEHARKLAHKGCQFVKLSAASAASATADLLLLTHKAPPGRELATLIELIAERAPKILA